MCVKLGHPKVRPSSARETFSNLGLIGGKVGNSMENWPYLRNGKRYG